MVVSPLDRKVKEWDLRRLNERGSKYVGKNSSIVRNLETTLVLERGGCRRVVWTSYQRTENGFVNIKSVTKRCGVWTERQREKERGERGSHLRKLTKRFLGYGALWEERNWNLGRIILLIIEVRVRDGEGDRQKRGGGQPRLERKKYHYHEKKRGFDRGRSSGKEGRRTKRRQSTFSLRPGPPRTPYRERQSPSFDDDRDGDHRTLLLSGHDGLGYPEVLFYLWGLKLHLTEWKFTTFDKKKRGSWTPFIVLGGVETRSKLRG